MDKNKWFRNPDLPVTEGQKRAIRGMLNYLNLSEYWLHRGTNKTINELSMHEADQVIKKLSQIKKK